MILSEDSQNEVQDEKRENSYIRSSIDAYRNIDGHKIFRGILRHSLLILSVTAAFTALGYYLSQAIFTDFQAHSVLIYQEDYFGEKDDSFRVTHLTLPAAVEIITLPTQLRAIKSILDLDLTTDQIKGMIKVELPARESNLIDIVVSGNDPNFILDIANTAAKVAVNSTQEMNKRQWQAAYAFFKTQEQELRNKIDVQNREIAQFRKEHRYVGADATGVSTVTALRDIENKLQVATLDYKKMLVEYENLKREVGKLPDQIERPTLSDNTLESKAAQLETSLLEARTKYAPGNPKIQALESQIESLQNVATANSNKESKAKLYQINPTKEKLNIDLINMQAKLRASLKLRDELAKIAEKSDAEASSLSEEHVSFGEMMTKRTRLEDDIKLNLSKQRTLEVLLNLGKSDLEIYQLAEYAKPAKKPVPGLVIVLLSALVGFVTSAGIAGVMELLDKRIRTPKQFRSLFDLPVFAAIPKLSRLKASQIDQRSLFYTRKIAERLQLEHPHFRSIAIASSTEYEGKSLWAYHLAQYYKQMGKSVILLEFDFRDSPCFDESVKRYPLEKYLRGDVQMEQIISRQSIDRIKAGSDPIMKELMKTEAMHELWDYLQHEYDLVIIDTPGIIDEDYAINAICIADCCLYVVNSSKTTTGYVTESFETLEIYGIKPIGVILNCIKAIYADSYQEQAVIRKSKRQNTDQFVRSITKTEA